MAARAVLVSLVALGLGPLQASAGPQLRDVAGRYVISARDSRIAFTVPAVGGAEVHGRFGKFAGSFDIDGKNLASSSVRITIFPQSVSTGERRVEGFLRSDAIFDAANSPEIVFRSTRVRRTGDDTAVIEGRLTARGRTFGETFNARLDRASKGTIRFRVDGRILRSRYHMDAGTPIYSNVVNFNMTLVGKRG